MNTKLNKDILNDKCLLRYLPIKSLFNIVQNYDYELCYEALFEKGSSSLYEEISDWFGIFIYDSKGEKHLVGLICINDSYHTEFKTDNKKPLHISEIEIEPKFRGGNFNGNNKIHAFSRALVTLEKGAKEAGYNLITLQAIDELKIPLYEHVGFHKVDYTKYNPSIIENGTEQFYNKEHPYMVKEI